MRYLAVPLAIFTLLVWCSVCALWSVLRHGVGETFAFMGESGEELSMRPREPAANPDRPLFERFESLGWHAGLHALPDERDLLSEPARSAYGAGFALGAAYRLSEGIGAGAEVREER